MTLKLVDIEVHGIGRKASSRDEMWCTINMGLQEGDPPLRSQLELRLFVTSGDQVTMQQVRREARDRATAILRAALTHLEEHDIDALESIAAAN